MNVLIQQMAPWVKKCFVDFLPKYLFIERPNKEEVAGPFDTLPLSQQSIDTTTIVLTAHLYGILQFFSAAFR